MYLIDIVGDVSCLVVGSLHGIMCQSCHLGSFDYAVRHLAAPHLWRVGGGRLHLSPLTNLWNPLFGLVAYLIFAYLCIVNHPFTPFVPNKNWQNHRTSSTNHWSLNTDHGNPNSPTAKVWLWYKPLVVRCIICEEKEMKLPVIWKGSYILGVGDGHFFPKICGSKPCFFLPFF